MTDSEILSNTVEHQFSDSKLMCSKRISIEHKRKDIGNICFYISDISLCTGKVQHDPFLSDSFLLLSVTAIAR